VVASGVRKKTILILLCAIAAVPIGFFAVAWLRYPSDKTVEGAYLRVVKAVIRDDPTLAFAYLETPAQHACYTIGGMRRRSVELIRAHYPEPEKQRLLELYGKFASAPDGADVFALYARQEGWFSELSRDMSGVKGTEVQGERASVTTMRGTRYAFRRRENGIWGMTMFTAKLLSESERASRDAAVIEQAAKDYARVKP